MTIRKIAFSLAAALTLSACGSGTPVQTGPTKALPPEFINAVMEAAFAETIAEECRSLRYNTAREDKLLNSYAVRLAAAGYTERDLRVGANRMEGDAALQRKAIKMIDDRNINVISEASWCAAGKREKARGTNIGRYLV